MDFLEKIRLGALAQAHNFADMVLDLDSVGALEQQVRDLQNNHKGLKNDLAEAEGHVNLVTQDRDERLAEVVELQRDVDTFLTDDNPENDKDALPVQARLNALQEEADALNEEVVSGTKVAAQLREAVGLVGTKLSTGKMRLSTLRSLERTAKHQANVVGAFEKANEILGEGLDADIDSRARKLREQAAVTNVKFEQAMEGIKTSVGQDVSLAQASADLVRRKRELAARVVSQSPTAEPAAG